MHLLNNALKQSIKDWAEEKRYTLSDHNIETMLKGVRHWYDVTVGDSISTAYSDIKNLSEGDVFLAAAKYVRSLGAIKTNRSEMIEALNAFNNAMGRVVAAWGTLDDDDQDCGNGDRYPFEKSFDEMYGEVNEWILKFVDELKESDKIGTHSQMISPMLQLNDALKLSIKDWAQEEGITLPEHRVAAMLRGVRHWYDVTIGDSISDAYTEIQDADLSSDFSKSAVQVGCLKCGNKNSEKFVYRRSQSCMMCGHSFPLSEEDTRDDQVLLTDLSASALNDHLYMILKAVSECIDLTVTLPTCSHFEEVVRGSLLEWIEKVELALAKDQGNLAVLLGAEMTEELIEGTHLDNGLGIFFERLTEILDPLTEGDVSDMHFFQFISSMANEADRVRSERESAANSECDADTDRNIEFEAPSPSDMQYLWEKLTDHPMVDDPGEQEHIQDPFYIWPAGTHREVIWKWFDKHDPRGVVWYLYGVDARTEK